MVLDGEFKKGPAQTCAVHKTKLLACYDDTYH